VSPSRAADWEALAIQNKLTPSDVESITKKLDRMDSDSEHGPWTRRSLELISAQPGVVSTILARQMGIERYGFKAMIYKMKKLGLTYSLDVGYSISPRGRAYLRFTASGKR
jgi:hypothetical protein